MSQTTDHIGYEIARAALAHLPPEVRGPLLEFLGPPIGALFDAFCELLGAGDDDAKQEAVLSPLLAAGGLPPGEAFLDADLPLSETSTSASATRLAQQCGRLFGPAMQGVLLTQAGVKAADDGEKGGGESGNTPLAASPQEREQNWRKILTELGHGDLTPELEKAGVFDEVDPVPFVAAGVMFTPEKVARMLRALVAILGNLHAEFLEEAQRMLAAGLEDAGRRTAIAASLALAAKRAKLANSDFRIGNKVHRVLQNLYVNDYKAHHDLVVERYSRKLGRAEAVVVGPSTKGLRRSFEYVFRNNLDRDFFFRALQLALATPKLDKDTRMRADLINVVRGSIWEIKPVASAVTGVWQETMYRLSFNIVRRFLLFASKLPPVRPTSLESGSAWLGVSSAWTKIDPENPALFTLSPIFVTTESLRPAVAVPFQLSVLPGLVPYFVITPESLQKWVEALEKLAEAARRKALELMKKIAESLKQLAEDVLEALEGAVQVIAKVLLFIVAILVAIMAVMSGLGGQPATPGFTPGTIRPPGREEDALHASIVDGLLFIPWPGKARGGGVKPGSGPPERTDVNFGSVIVGSIPVKSLESFLTNVQLGFASLVDRSLVAFDRRTASMTSGGVA